jgi:hypothetical protein
MPEFGNTIRGAKFYDADVPRMIEAVSALTREVKELREARSKTNGKSAVESLKLTRFGHAYIITGGNKTHRHVVHKRIEKFVGEINESAVFKNPSFAVKFAETQTWHKALTPKQAKAYSDNAYAQYAGVQHRNPCNYFNISKHGVVGLASDDGHQSLTLELDWNRYAHESASPHCHALVDKQFTGTQANSFHFHMSNIDFKHGMSFLWSYLDGFIENNLRDALSPLCCEVCPLS